jgi:hypothetical protein
MVSADAPNDVKMAARAMADAANRRRMICPPKARDEV